MSESNWQKSTYSEEGSSCVYLKTARDGTVSLRESEDRAEVVLSTGPRQLRALISAIRARSGGTR